MTDIHLKSEKIDRPNMQCLGVGKYVVFTQAGLKAARKEHVRRSDRLDMTFRGNWPMAYPSVVHFLNTSSFSAQVRSTHLNTYYRRLQGELTTLTALDPYLLTLSDKPAR